MPSAILWQVQSATSQQVLKVQTFSLRKALENSVTQIRLSFFWEYIYVVEKITSTFTLPEWLKQLYLQVVET